MSCKCPLQLKNWIAKLVAKHIFFIMNIVPLLLYISSSKLMSSCLLWSLGRFVTTFFGHYSVLSPIVAHHVFFFHLATWTYKLVIILNWLLSPFYNSTTSFSYLFRQVRSCIVCTSSYSSHITTLPLVISTLC
jgi:hypothetical protein